MCNASKNLSNYRKNLSKQSNLSKHTKDKFNSNLIERSKVKSLIRSNSENPLKNDQKIDAECPPKLKLRLNVIFKEN